MDKNKIIALGAIFAVAIMFGSAVLVGLIGNSGDNQESLEEKVVKLSDYRMGNADITINNIKDGLKYIPEGSVLVQYNKKIYGGGELYNNTTEIESILNAEVYLNIPDKDGNQQIIMNPLEFQKLTDYENASFVALVPKNGRLPVYANHTFLLKGNPNDPVNLTYQVPGNPTIVGSQYTVPITLEIIDGKRSPTRVFDNIVNYIDDSINPDIEFLTLGLNDSFKTHYRAAYRDSDNDHARVFLFEDMSEETQIRVKAAVDAKPESEKTEKTFTEIDENVVKVLVKSPGYAEFENESIKIAEAVRGPIDTEN